MNKKQKKNLIRIIVSALLLIIVENIETNNIYISLLLHLIPYLIIGYDILRKAFKGIFHGEVFDENFLMVIATIGAMLSQEFEEGVAVMLFYQIGEWFQSYAIGKSRKNIASLMDIRPDYANIEIDNVLQQVDPNNIKINDVIIVKVGEKVPIDGVVVEGSTSLNTIALTGEAKPKDVKVNDEVISGCINMTSPIKIRTTKLFSDSTVSKVLSLVESATSNKSKSEDFIARFAHYYTPVVCYSALALCIIPPIFLYLLTGNLDFATWFNRALTFLVISCPCALVISIPLTFFAGIGGASNAGVLIKGSNHLENLSKCKTIAFDKTGTMTLGIFEVTTIHNNELSKEELLKYCAYAEAYSNHPIGKSIIKEYGKKIDKTKITSISEIAGKGINAIIDNSNVLVGNTSLMQEFNIKVQECKDEGTIVHIAINNDYKGHIHIGDKLKPTAISAIKELNKLNINNIIMLTGDDKLQANKYSKLLGIKNTYANLLPQDKVNIIEQLLANKKQNEMLAFVGDGINDAPVIARADVGISMGALGSDAAIEAADIVLMDDDPLKISKAIKISKKCMRIVKENIYFAIGVKIICLILGAFGIANMWLAVFADVGVMILAVINAIRALAVKNI